MTALITLASESPSAGLAAEQAEARVLALLQDAPLVATVPADLFEQLGWDLPDGGATVKALADAAPGGAFDPRALEEARIHLRRLGYSARWHVVRYRHYGLDWDITGLLLTPARPSAGLPTVAFINGGSANWYEFFVTPLNGPAVGQYLAQRVPVLLISIPGNYRSGGWDEPPAVRKPAYLIDRELGADETKLRNAIYTFTLVVEGVRQLVERATRGPLLIAGHSTGGEIQFLLRDALRTRLNGLSLGWGTGGPASLRRSWEHVAASGLRLTASAALYPPISVVRERTVAEYARTYIGPLNPLGPGTPANVAGRWFARENRRRPQFKQPLQDIEHRGERERRAGIEAEIRELAGRSAVRVPAEQIVADLFSTLRTPIDGYRRMIWTTAAGDDGHWDPDPAKARELFVAKAFQQANPKAEVRVLVFDVPMSHYGHIEKPRQLAGGILAAVKWLYR